VFVGVKVAVAIGVGWRHAPKTQIVVHNAEARQRYTPSTGTVYQRPVSSALPIVPKLHNPSTAASIAQTSSRRASKFGMPTTRYAGAKALCWKQYKAPSTPHKLVVVSVHPESVSDDDPTTETWPKSESELQSVQEPSTLVWRSPDALVDVQTAAEGRLAPDSDTEMDASSVPSIRSVQSSATVVPPTKTYGPVECTNREAAEVLVSESHALKVPSRLAPSASA
jgi:hypothetical protein